jgi:DNA mismatch repair protein MutS
VPNSIELDTDMRSFALITGPNMSGKSTYLRQIALIVLLAQAGSFVPAEEASIGLVDRIFCRVGASDNLARGESTFLVEMNETSFILHTSTEKSLIIMDEVGRGTSTHDGLSIAWAVSEYLLSKGCKTLFATHYHELTVMENPAIQRLYLDVQEENGEIVFLKRVREGSAARSYGLHVAKLAGLPPAVLERAHEILSTLEAVEHSIPKGSGSAEVTPGKQPAAEASLRTGQTRELPGQASLFGREEMIQRELSMLDVNAITPLQALELLARWKKDLEAE